VPQLCWDDVREGTALPPLVKTVTTRQLVKYAGASGDYNEIHYDKDYAQSTGLAGVIVHGALKNAFLAQLVTDWIGVQGTLRKLACQYRGMDVPGDRLTCQGRVLKRYVQDGQRLVDLELWLENSKGEKTTLGSATVELPAGGSAASPGFPTEP